MAKKDVHDVIIIGGGIASHTAAIYSSRADLKPLIFAGAEPDQLSLTTVVENYPGFPEGVMGPELIQNCRKQAEKFGAEYINEKADKFEIKKNYFEITSGKKKYKSRTAIICTGASPRKLKIPGEDKYFGRGVSTCAVCDAAFYRKRTAVVVGGGDSAMEESLALNKFADKIYIVHRRDKFRASKIMQGRVLKEKKIKVIWDSTVMEVLGDNKGVTGVKVKNLKNNNLKEIKCDGMFLAIGHIPNTKIFNGKVKLDKQGFIVTDKYSRTNVEGVYSAGDVQDRIFKQAVTSAGTGCECAINAEKHLEDLKNKGKY